MRNTRLWLLVTIDICIYAAVYFACGLLDMGFGNGVLLSPMGAAKSALMLSVIMAVRLLLKLYDNMWRYANSRIYMQMVFADAFGYLIAVFILYAAGKAGGNLFLLLSLATIFDISSLCSRFAYQLFYKHIDKKDTQLNKIGVAIVGAGSVGARLADELMYNYSSHYRPVCFIDRDSVKVGSKLRGLRVYEESKNIIGIIKNLPVQEIFIAIQDVDEDKMSYFYNLYIKTGCKIKLYDFPMKDSEGTADPEKRVIREFRIEDLLFRSTKKINSGETIGFYAGKTVLVTGGGGSIGSELCRQSAKMNPKQLIVLDIYENNAYSLQQELIKKYGNSLSLSVEIASIRDRERLEEIFRYYKPHIVFHAAAHKHVPLMEHSGSETVKNNIVGTYNVADMAEKYGTEKFIMISTDKAVNPTNIMGASKRMCEMIVQSRRGGSCTFSAVRFGNVLGSNGSVVPLFKKQIAAGGPVTITDKRIIRYFMTIPEASQLVLEAGAMAREGELFVLDMGKPVKILDLAENMIRLSGFQPYVDIDIKEVGLRPGEKLYEELLIKTEKLTKTENDMIFVEKDQPFTREEIENKLNVLLQAVKQGGNGVGSAIVSNAMKSVVPTYKTPEEINSMAEKSKEMMETAKR